MPVVSSQGPRSVSFSSAYGAVPWQSPFDTIARPATQQSPCADVPILRTLKASFGSIHNTEPHESSHHAGKSPKTGLIQSDLQGYPNSGPASGGPQRHNSIMHHPTAIEGSFSTGPHAGTPQRFSNTELSPGALQSSTKAQPPPPTNAKPPPPPDIEKGSASQPVRTPSGGLTCMGCQQKMAQACTHCRCLHVPPPQAAQCAGHMRLSALSALPADCSLSQVGAIAGPQHSQSDCMLITHQAKMMYAV